MVEFGIVALLFVLLMFAVVDFGFLLNSWIRLSAATRDVARLASVGGDKNALDSLVKSVAMPGVSSTIYPPFTGPCCQVGDKVVLSISYYPCIPNNPPGTCTGALPTNAVDSTYWGGTGPVGSLHPAIGDTIVVTLQAPGMEVLTPLVRPFFGCDGSQLHCNVQLNSSTMVRFESR